MYLSAEQLSELYKFRYPLDDVKPTMITQQFGENLVSFYKELGMKGHNGIDFSVPIGTPVYSAFDGLVQEAKTWDTGGIGIFIQSDPFRVDDKLVYLSAVYWHLSSLNVHKGDRVSAGQVIALSGNTGRYTTGPHLHFGITPFYQTPVGLMKDTDNGYGGAIDPMPFFLDDKHKIPPVDRKYDLVFDGFQNPTEKEEWFEDRKKKLKDDAYVKRVLGRNPTERELIAMSFGQWSPHDLTEVNMQNWHNDTYVEFRAKILQAKLK